MKRIFIGGALLLLAGVVLVVVLRDTPAQQQAISITDGSWQWVSAESNGTTTTPTQSDKFVLTFVTDGTFSSGTDCNRLAGSYTLDGQNLTFGPIASTMMYCEGSQETVYSSLLAETASYAINDHMLTLQLKDNKGSMQFTHLSGTY